MDDDEPGGVGFGGVLAAVILSFTLVTIAGIVLADINSTQAVLIGGLSAVIAAITTVKSGRWVERSDR